MKLTVARTERLASKLLILYIFRRSCQVLSKLYYPNMLAFDFSRARGPVEISPKSPANPLFFIHHRKRARIETPKMKIRIHSSNS